MSLEQLEQKPRFVRKGPFRRGIYILPSLFTVGTLVCGGSGACERVQESRYAVLFGIPVAAYGPRGSAQAVANIRKAIASGGCAVLLANHGVLVFHRTPEQAVMVGGIVEEAARDAITAMSLGGPIAIEPEMRAAALQRAAAFGVVS